MNRMIIPTIVVVAYNRPESLKRILNSIQNADYSGFDNVRICISIDGGGSLNESVVDIANTFEWRCGEKEIIHHKDNLGLRNHVISCGNLTERFENIIILEEDCYVSKDFYSFSNSAMMFYYEEPKIAGVSLYSYNIFESFNVPFNPLLDGYDTYFLQVPSSLGQIWTKRQWSRFIAFYNLHPKIEQTDLLPKKVKQWPETSWKKYFYKYMVVQDLYFVYPHHSFSTNFGEVGSNFDQPTDIYQTKLTDYCKGYIYKFVNFTVSNNKYDAFFEIFPECLIALGCKIDIDTCIDMNGSKELELYKNKYLLSLKECSAPIMSFGIQLQPILMNLIMNNDGSFLSYGLMKNFKKLKQSKLYYFVQAQSPFIFNTGVKMVYESKKYKLGTYIVNPFAFIKMLSRKFNLLRGGTNRDSSSSL